MEGIVTTILKDRSISLVMTFGSAEIILDMNSLHQKNGDSCILIYFSIDQRYSIQQTERFYWIGEKYVLF